jgi:hypothetical protein
MADYYPLIVKAVSGLDKDTGEIRRELYDRARVALVAQLRSVDPPLNESDITRERLALEEAIRKVETDASKRRPEPAEEPERPSLSDEGLRGFRAVVAEAEGLGDAAAEANRAAHEAYEAVPTDRPPEIPAAESAAVTAPETRAAAAPAAPQEPGLFEPFEPDSQFETPTLDQHLDEPAWHPEAETPPAFRHEDQQAVEDESYPPPVRSYGRLIKVIVLLLIVGVAAGAAYWHRDAITSMVASLRSGPTTTQQQAAQPAGKPKITDRVGGGSAPNAANAPSASVAQKVVLYDEDPNDPQGKRYVGSALWRTETVSPGPGLAPEIAIRADVEVPERHMHITLSLRRNTDKALPASHTIEIMFNLPADFAEGGVNNIPGVLMKQDEQARGVPLAGLAVKVTNGYFLIGLSSVDVDQQRNIDLLKTRDWFDIPLVYTSGKRAILAMEKGVAGVRVFEEAFRAWGQ